jgi:hypothetical protein
MLNAIERVEIVELPWALVQAIAKEEGWITSECEASIGQCDEFEDGLAWWQ